MGGAWSCTGKQKQTETGSKLDKGKAMNIRIDAKVFAALCLSLSKDKDNARGLDLMHFKGGQAVATDGFMLGCGRFTGSAPGGVCISPDPHIIKAAKSKRAAAVKIGKKYTEVVCCDGNSLAISRTAWDTPYDITLSWEKAKPKAERLIFGARTPFASAITRYVADCTKLFDGQNSQEKSAAMWYAQEDDPLRQAHLVRYKGRDDFYSVVMPFCVDNIPSGYPF